MVSTCPFPVEPKGDTHPVLSRSVYDIRDESKVLQDENFRSHKVIRNDCYIYHIGEENLLT